MNDLNIKSTITSQVAKYATSIQYKDIPSEVVEFSKTLMLDCFANMIGGASLTPGKLSHDYYVDMGGNPESTVFTSGKKLPTENTAYVNAFLANTLDYDDAYKQLGHPGATIIPPIFAIAERDHKSGKDIIKSIVAAYETNIRIAEAIIATPQRFQKVWGLGPNQTMGATIAAGVISDLTENQMIQTMALGGYHAPIPFANKIGMTLEQRPVSWLKNNYGWMAKGAVIASIYGKKDFIGNGSILDGEDGYWIMSGSDRCDFEHMVKGLGEEYRLLTTEFKPYACCRWAHASVEACEKLYQDESLDINEIKNIDVHGYSMMKINLAESNPTTSYDAQFSLPYLVALTLNGKSPKNGLFEEDLTNKEILSLSNKVEIHVNEKYENAFYKKGMMPAKVIVEFNNGDTKTVEIMDALGSTSNPFPENFMQDKFYSLVSPVLGKDKADRLYNLILTMDKVEDIALEISNIYSN